MNDGLKATAAGHSYTLWQRTGALVVAVGLPVAAVGLVVLLMINTQQGVQAGAVGLSELLPVGYAFGAGMVASVNPCGFFLLPSYISYQIGVDESGYAEASGPARLGRALVLGGTATGGFIVLFAGVGSVLALGGTSLTIAFPYAGVAIGAGMLALGGWLLFSGRSLSITAPRQIAVTPRRNQRNVFLFGIGYAVASLCCTLPIFLVIVGSGIATGSFTTSLSQFISYALGMGTILVTVTISTAVFRGGVTRWLERALPYVKRTSTLFLVAAGGYILWYWLIYADYFF